MFQPGRVLTREGLVIRIDLKRKKEKKNYLFLFSDILVISKPRSKNTKSKYEHKETFPLFQCTLQETVSDPGVEDQDRELCFKLTLTEGATFIWKASTWFEKKSWVTDFTKCIQTAPKIEIPTEDVELP